MQLLPSALALSILLLLLPSATSADNITRLLDNDPDFSTFNSYLTETNLAPEINRRETITVCAVDNAVMLDLISKNLTIDAIRNVLSLHVLLDYYDAKKLHQITNGTSLAATMFQATGSAIGSSGFVNITDLKGGQVGFGPKDGPITSTFVKSIAAIPYNISVIQISSILSSTEALAPAPAPSLANITALMSAHGCKVFAETLLANPDAEKTFEHNVESGLTIFCPGDQAMRNFAPKFNNLTAAGKQSLLEYHGIPIYQSLSGLKSSNGLTNTLATDGPSTYDFTVQNNGTDVTIITRVVTAKIVHTLFDKPQLAIYEVDKVLIPRELLRGVLAPAPAPGPVADAESPKPSRKNKHNAPAAPADSPSDAPGGDVADQTADNNGASGFKGGRFVVVILSLWLSYLKL